MKHKKTKAISFPPVLMAFFMLFLSLNLEAYEFTADYKQGFYWPSFPIKMTRFAADEPEAEGLLNLVDDAVNEWEGIIGKNIWDVSPVERSSNFRGNYIRWSKNFQADTGYSGTHTLAVTIRFNRGTFFERVLIIINGTHSALINDRSAIHATILHELGHTIGLDHSNNHSIMSASLGGTRSLQYDDMLGANAAIDSMISKQSEGYVSPFSTISEGKVAACGSIEDISKSQGGRGMGNFIGSLLIGLILMKLADHYSKKLVRQTV